ncbi:MAG: DUF885 domain-containing protein [Lachnospiraceae bacterium]|nr:DUF885 domain-containing protein [Lachnospiraceae bacterium]
MEALKEQKDFDAYTESLFCEEVNGNTINLHYTLANPEKYGIKNPVISLGSLSEETYQNSISSLENMSAAVSAFNYDALTTKQQLTYDVLIDYCTKELEASPFFYFEEPLRCTTGTHAELPILLAEYAFYQASDVTDYLSLLSCIEDYFKEIEAFEEEKANRGFFMSDFAAQTVIDACLKFTENPKENYLITTFNKRIDALTELSEEKKNFYKEKNETLVLNDVIPAYKNLANTIERLKNTGTNNGGLCYFQQGKEYYKHLVYSSTGSDKSIEELQNCVTEQRNADFLTLRNLLTEYPELINVKDTPILEDDPIKILEHLQTAMCKDFSPASNTNFDLNYVDASMEDTLAPAFYLTAPIDNTNHNVIYINKSNGYSGIQLFTTLAHEGYPGHLYQTTESYQANLSPIRSLLNYPGYTEGWATYVEMLSYDYAGLEDKTAEMHRAHQSALLSLYATVDMGIHYDGWTLTDTINFFSEYGIKDQSVIQSIYELIVEEPAHYLKYYVGYLEFLELKKNAQTEFKDKYSNRAFHDAVIRIGPAPFSIIKKYLPVYYAS